MSKKKPSNPEASHTPARAKEPRFSALGIAFRGLLLLLIALGLWKAYELIVQAISWYEASKAMVNTFLVSIGLVVFVGAVIWMTRSFRGRRKDYEPLEDVSKKIPSEAELHTPVKTALNPSDLDAPDAPLSDAVATPRTSMEGGKPSSPAKL